MDPGARVTVIALCAELNGTQGVVLSYDSSQGRYEVQRDALAEPTWLQPANLHPHASPLEEARAAVARAKAKGPLHGAIALFERLGHTPLPAEDAASEPSGSVLCAKRHVDRTKSMSVTDS